MKIEHFVCNGSACDAAVEACPSYTLFDMAYFQLYRTLNRPSYWLFGSIPVWNIGVYGTMEGGESVETILTVSPAVYARYKHNPYSFIPWQAKLVAQDLQPKEHEAAFKYLSELRVKAGRVLRF